MDKNTRNQRQDYHERLFEITTYIDDHFRNPISLGETARLVGLAPAYLSRFFKKHMGITFSEYLDMVRLDYAFDKTTTTSLPILQIADESGFSNYRMFVNKFKLTYGQTPLKKRLCANPAADKTKL